MDSCFAFNEARNSSPWLRFPLHCCRLLRIYGIGSPQTCVEAVTYCPAKHKLLAVTMGAALVAKAR